VGRCLVLGGKGFIGSHLVEGLLDHGHTVRVFDRLHVAPLFPATVADRVETIDGDFESETDVAAALQGCDTCFHLVSTTLPKNSNDDPSYDVRTNLLPTMALLRLAADARIARIVFLSSGGTVYGRPRYTPIDEAHPTDPVCSYGIVKLTIEKYLALYRTLRGIETVVLRFSNPYGERQRIDAAQGAVAAFLGKALRGEPVELWGDGSVVRDYVYIGDAVEAMLNALAYRGPERVFNIGSGEGHSLLEVLAAIETAIGRPVARRHLPARAVDVPVNVLSIDRARAELGWEPRTAFADGVARTLRWLHEQPAE
jgi:UDP-glucose 4-epimerase